MRPILYGLLLLGSFLSIKPDLYAQCIPDTSAFLDDGVNTFQGCATFTETPNLWFRSHGTPQIYPGSSSADGYIEMLSNTASGSEGIYFNLGSPLVAGNNYDVLMTYNFYSGATNNQQPANGSFAAYAASGVTTPVNLDACQDPAPTGPARTPMYSKTANNQVIDLQYDIQTASLIPSAYPQVWIYPTVTPGAAQVALDVSEIKVCPSCFAVVTYSTSTFSPLPVQVNGQDITISEPAQDVPTLVEATQAIYLQKGFSATHANNATFVAEISPYCAYSNEPFLSMRRNLDSSALGNLSPGATSPSAADSAASGLRLYPTLTRGTVILTGRPADLANADIIIVSEIGQIMYRQYNAAATTLQLNLSNLPNGMYFIQIRQPAKVTTKKVIINH